MFSWLLTIQGWVCNLSPISLLKATLFPLCLSVFASLFFFSTSLLLLSSFPSPPSLSLSVSISLDMIIQDVTTLKGTSYEKNKQIKNVTHEEGKPRGITEKRQMPPIPCPGPTLTHPGTFLHKWDILLSFKPCWVGVSVIRAISTLSGIQTSNKYLSCKLMSLDVAKSCRGAEDLLQIPWDRDHNQFLTPVQSSLEPLSEVPRSSIGRLSAY